MFMELVIFACLSGSVHCQDFRLLYDAQEVSLVACMVSAQPAAARWQAQHPRWEIRRWSCGLPDPTRGKA